MLRKLLPILLVLSLLWIPGCATSPPQTLDIPWKAADLRTLEAPGLPDPSYDLIAAYARQTKTDLELRFDLLGSPDPYSYELLILLDTEPGGSSQLPWGEPTGMEWDLGFRFPTQGIGRAFDASGAAVNIRPRIQRLSVQDAAVFRLSLSELKEATTASTQDIHFQAHLLLPGRNEAVDSIGPLAVSGPAPQARADLLLAFWATLPAATPAQALRRWNGAHTGPYGQRHGLRVLLEASRRAGIPVALLDLKRPEPLAALETLGGLDLVRRMAREKLLILPETLSGDPQAAAESARFSAQAGQQYRLPDSQFLYGTMNGSHPGKPAGVFAVLQDSRHLQQWENRKVIPLPGREISADETQVNEEGLTIAVRTELLSSALNAEADDLLVLGGSLPASAWGDLLMADPAFTYLAGHPWIQVLNGDDLLRFPARQGAPDCPDLLCLPETASSSEVGPAVLEALRAAPQGFFTDLAWKNYLSLTEPTTDEKLRVLRAGYLGQIGPLLAAARWNEAPMEQSTCAEDLDWDGAPECVLSSEEVFLVIDPLGARLVLAVSRYNGKPFQIIGPRSQLVTGLGDRLEWRPELGLGGDPQEIPGAFADQPNAWQVYQAEAQPGQVALTQPESATQKVFRISSSGFHLELASESAAQTSLPLLLLDGQTWQPGGYARYSARQAAPERFTWDLASGVSVQVTAQGAALTPASFSESLPFLKEPEDPNADLPPGFFLPFPMAVLNVETQGSFRITIEMEPTKTE